MNYTLKSLEVLRCWGYAQEKLNRTALVNTATGLATDGFHYHLNLGTTLGGEDVSLIRRPHFYPQKVS
jgi:hypothetical protein